MEEGEEGNRKERRGSWGREEGRCRRTRGRRGKMREVGERGEGISDEGEMKMGEKREGKWFSLVGVGEEMDERGRGIWKKEGKGKRGEEMGGVEGISE